MKKTKVQDVYKLYSIFSQKNKDKEVYIKKRIGSAYIPTFILSIKCKVYFLNKESIIMRCIFNSNKNKWIPIEEANDKKLDIINKEKRIKIIEQDYEYDNELE